MFPSASALFARSLKETDDHSQSEALGAKEPEPFPQYMLIAPGFATVPAL